MPARTTLGFATYPTNDNSKPTFSEWYHDKKSKKKIKQEQSRSEDNKEESVEMARTSRTTGTTATRRSARTTTKPAKPSLLSRLRNKNQAKVSTTQSTNPITGTTTTTQKTKTHPHGIGYRGHGGNGPMASNHESHYTTGATTHHQKRKPSIGDKISGAMTKLGGSLTGRSGKKAAGQRRMNGTDGRGSRRVVV